MNLILVAGFLVIGLMCVWPEGVKQSFFLSISSELRLIIIVITGGLLGSSLRTSSFLFDGSNNNSFRFYNTEYIWRVFSGAPLSIFFYIMIRGVILNSNAASNMINGSGIFMFSMVIGFFSFESLKRLTFALKKLNERESMIENRIERISTTLGVEILDNYNGYFNYTLSRIYNQDAMFSEQNLNEKEYTHELKAYFSPQSEETTSFYYNDLTARESKQIQISGGRDTDVVIFSIVPHISGNIMFPSENRLEFRQDKRSENVDFKLIIPSDGLQDFWIEILQKNRLVAVVTPDNFKNFN